MVKPLSIDEYISGFPDETREKLEQLCKIVKNAAPQAVGVISYGMPAFKLNGIVVWFAAHTKHIGLYPKASGIEAFKAELSGFIYSKGAIQFPHDKPLPFELITRIIEFRVTENLNLSKTKNKRSL
jgi:uncharacterized protein YdhG (YjbR/CyaY superfamily)